MRDLRIAVGKSGSGFDVRLPRSLKAERHGDVAVLLLARPEKRNAIDDPTVFGIEAFFAAVPDWIKAVVLASAMMTSSDANTASPTIPHENTNRPPR